MINSISRFMFYSYMHISYLFFIQGRERERENRYLKQWREYRLPEVIFIHDVCRSRDTSLVGITSFTEVIV